MVEDDFSYFRVRAKQEQAAAESATCVEARKCHEALAHLYRFRLDTLLAAADAACTAANGKQPSQIDGLQDMEA